MKWILRSLSFALLSCPTAASAADYVYSQPLGTPLDESVRYGFADTVTFTPTVSGVYAIDVVPSTVYDGCSTRYCHSKWSIVTTMTSEVLTDGTNTWTLQYGNVSQALVAGVPYVLRLTGVGTGTGVYAGYGAYAVTVSKLN